MFTTSSQVFWLSVFLKDFIYLFLESGEGRKKETERNIHVREKHQSVASRSCLMKVWEGCPHLKQPRDLKPEVSIPKPESWPNHEDLFRVRHPWVQEQTEPSIEAVGGIPHSQSPGKVIHLAPWFMETWRGVKLSLSTKWMLSLRDSGTEPLLAIVGGWRGSCLQSLEKQGRIRIFSKPHRDKVGGKSGSSFQCPLLP